MKSAAYKNRINRLIERLTRANRIYRNAIGGQQRSEAGIVIDKIRKSLPQKYWHFNI